MSYLCYLCLFAYSGVQHILCCVFALFFCVLCTLLACFCGLSFFDGPFDILYSLYLILLYRREGGHSRVIEKEEYSGIVCNLLLLVYSFVIFFCSLNIRRLTKVKFYKMYPLTLEFVLLSLNGMIYNVNDQDNNCWLNLENSSNKWQRSMAPD